MTDFNVSHLSQRCLTSFFTSQAQMLDLELSLNNQTEEQNNFLNIIYGQTVRQSVFPKAEIDICSVLSILSCPADSGRISSSFLNHIFRMKENHRDLKNLYFTI